MAEPVASRCLRCGGTLYVCYAEVSAARARACDCQLPCPLCGGAGFRRREDDGYEFLSPCRCQALERRLARFNRSGVPAKFYDRSLFNYEPQSTQQAAAQAALGKFLKHFQPGCRGFLLMGPVGTGKTHLLCAVVSQLALELGVSCRFVDFFHLLQDLREGFSQNRPTSELLAPLEAVSVLAIDELGKGKNTEWELSILDEVISKRYNQQRTTLFTTNYTDDPETTYSPPLVEPKVPPIRGPREARFDRRVLRETLAERVGPRIHSRLREMCDFHLVIGPDYRELRSLAP